MQRVISINSNTDRTAMFSTVADTEGFMGVRSNPLRAPAFK